MIRKNVDNRYRKEKNPANIDRKTTVRILQRKNPLKIRLNGENSSFKEKTYFSNSLSGIIVWACKIQIH